MLGAVLAGAQLGLSRLFPPALTAALLVGLWAGLTGLLHLDGFMDSCDGLLPPVSRERRLEIMKDSRAGAFGVIGLVLLLLVKYSAVLALVEARPATALLIIPSLARWAMVWQMARYPLARAKGLALFFGRGLGPPQLLLALAVAGGATLLGFGWPGLGLLALTWLVATGLARLALARLGGLTGDIYGATCELVEVLLLLVVVGLTAAPLRAQAPQPDRRFGLVQTYDDFAAASEAGAGYTRIKLYWDIIQPAGPADWQPANVPDPLLEADLAAGREVVGLIVRTPAWARDPDHPANAGHEAQRKDVPDMAEWARFVRRLVAQYQGRIHHWIIWNEPDVWDPNHPGSTWNGSEADYVLLLKTAYRTIKAFDPTMQVYMAGLTYWWDEEYEREQYLNRLLRLIKADPQAAAHGYYFDGVNFHLYYKPGQIYEILGQVRATLDDNGLADKTIWLNETNAPPSSDPLEPPQREPRFKASLAEQSAFIIQVHAVAFAAGAERVQLYKLFNSTAHPEDVQPFGLVRGDGSRRPAFAAYQVVTRYLAGFETVTLFEQGEVYTVVFERPADTVTVLWNMAPTPRRVSLNAITGQALLLDENGRGQPLAADGRPYRLELPPATCSSGDCFIGGPPRLIIEAGPARQRNPFFVQPTATPLPPTPLQILAVSPRRRFVFTFLVIMAGVTALLLLWQVGLRRGWG
jgi:adenosylcobinamide-GDP ribazoletransferase